MTRAILEGGFTWEEEVVGQKLGNRAVLGAAADVRRLSDRIHTPAETREALRALLPGQYLYQPTLTTADTFYDRYHIDRSVVELVDCRPDLVVASEVQGRLKLSVIDVKASPGLKLSHRIQATLYTLILEHLLSDCGIEDRVTGGDGGVWLYAQEEPEWFEIRSMRPPLERFLEHELVPMLDQPADKARWHLYFRCEWCEYFTHCRSEMRSTDDVSRMPYLSSHAKTFLGTLDPPVKTVLDLDRAVHDVARAATLDECASLRGKQWQLRAQTVALELGDSVVLPGSSLAMPQAENVRIIITLQSEPVSGQLYAYGIYAQGLKDVLGDNPKPALGIAATGDADTVAELERNLVRSLHTLLNSVGVYNAERNDEWRSQKSLQTYCFDTYERDLLTGVLMRRILDVAVAPQALELFFHFQQPDLVTADDHPAAEVFFPLVVLTTVVRSVLALPIEVAYRFSDVVGLVTSQTSRFEYTRNDFFSFELSNQLRSDAIFAVWSRQQEEYIERIATELRSRLWATNAVINGMREMLQGHGTLFAWPPKFFMPVSAGLREPVLSRLAFVTRYESVLQCLDIRQRRMGPIAERLRAGDAMLVTHADGDRWLIDAGHRDLDIPVDGFPRWLLVEETDDGNRASLSYDDHRNRSRQWIPRNVPVALTGIAAVEGSIANPNRAVRLAVTWSEQLPGPREGVRHVLMERYTDFTSQHILQELTALDGEGGGRLLPVVVDAQGCCGNPMNPEVAALSRLLAAPHMTASQMTALNGLLENEIQLVWGPPGTGKTYFLAAAILCLAEAHRRLGVTMRILVTAMTHAAIDNCLRKLVELDRRFGISTTPLPVGKLDGTRSGDSTGVEVVPSSTATAWYSSHAVAVLGGTAWAVRKGLDSNALDLLVIDEASQVKVPESAIPIRRLRRGGRVLMAGDHRQLPPIVHGAYPDPGEGEPLLHRSIFECLQRQDVAGRFTATLLENFRMNRTLCTYPREQVYVPGYDSATDLIGTRRLILSDVLDEHIADLVLDPDYPLVVGVLEGVRATAENRIEADLVAGIAARLRERLLTAAGGPYSDDEAGDRYFWNSGLFIVSPHHAQINAINRALERVRAWHAKPFVDTVDKMQGQECDAVVTSYGVSDVEFAMQEKEFIYSLNRLNVSMTRARAKSIVFLPRPLIEPPIQAYEDDRVAEGVAFMQGLVVYSERAGESSSIDLGGGASITLLRVPA